MELKFSTWPEVESYLKSSKTIVIPIGSTEQHGPNGLVGTDALCPEAVSAGIGKIILAVAVAMTFFCGDSCPALSDRCSGVDRANNLCGYGTTPFGFPGVYYPQTVHRSDLSDLRHGELADTTWFPTLLLFKRSWWKSFQQ